MLTHLFDEIDSRPLGLARVIVGVAAIIRALVALPELLRLTDELVMRAPYATWLPAPTVPLVIALVSIWLVAAILFALGWRVPATGTLLLLSIVAVLALDEQTYGNHLYLMAWLVLLLTLAGSGSGLNIRRTQSPVVRWPVLLLMAQLSIVYGFSALTKLNESFLSGTVLAGTLGQGLVGFPEGLRTPAFLGVVAATAVFVELFLAIFIWRRRFRPWAFLLGLGLHTSITLLMSEPLKLLTFTLEMLALYPLFLSHGKLGLIWDDACSYCRGWVDRFARFDILEVLEPMGASDSRNEIARADVQQAMHLVHAGDTSRGFRAVTETLEHLVPTLWVAPALRLPVISQIGEKWYRWQAARRSCPVGVGGSARLSPDSTGR